MSEIERRDRRRPYDSPRRREEAQATRAQIAAAARRQFAAHGWAATRVRDVARQAGVAEPTVYATYGSKAGLARALIDAVETSAELPESPEALCSTHREPPDQLAALVASDRRLFERGGDVIALARDANSAEPEPYAAYREGRDRGDRFRRKVFSRWPAGTLRDGVDVDAAADSFAALCNVDVYRILTQERGWSADRVERWWSDSLALLLLRQS